MSTKEEFIEAPFFLVEGKICVITISKQGK